MSAAGEGLAGRLLSGRYRLDRLLASGGMAQVWEATDEVLTRPVAVKILHPHLAADEKFVERFRREAIAAARLTHPSIVAIYDTSSDHGVEAIVMELVRGTNLRAVLDERHTLEAPEAVGVISQVAEALDVAHRAGVVHRDVKPANILLSNDGRVLVADFGIAKAAEGTDVADLTGTGTTLGTVKYLSPEQVEGRGVDARTDVYALGVVLYECLCGRPPFLADNEAATALARLHQEPMRPRNVKASVPRPVEAVVLRALARDPAERYSTAGDLRAALLAAERGEHPVELVDRTVADPGASPLPPPAPGAPTAAIAPPAGPGPATAPVGAATGATAVATGPWASGTPPRGLPRAPAPPRPKQAPGKRGPILVGVLVGVALLVVALLVSGSSDGGGGSIVGGPTTSGVAPSSGSGLTAAAYDPAGDQHENDAAAPKAVDGDPNTWWTTEGYVSRTIDTKPGVGLAVRLPSAGTIKSVTVVSPSSKWSASVYVATGTPADLSGWGAAVADKKGIKPGSTTFDLAKGGARGDTVLIWITDVGEDTLPSNAALSYARIAEVSVALK